MKKKIGVILLCIVTGLCTQGCNLGEERISKQGNELPKKTSMEKEEMIKSEQEKDNSDMIIVNEELLPNFHVNVKINKKKNNNGIYNGSIKEFDYNKVKKLFLENEKIKDKNEWKSDEFGEITCYSFFTTSGEMLTICPGQISYEEEIYNQNYFDAMTGDNGYLVDNLDEVVSKKKNKNSNDSNSALKKVKDLTEELGIPTKNEKVYYLDKDSLDKLVRQDTSDEKYKKYLESGQEPLKREFTKSDEVYFVTMEHPIGEGEIYTKDYVDADQNTIMGSKIIAMVKEGNIIMFDAGYIYDIQENSAKGNVFDEDSALDKLKERYRNRIINQPVNCRNIETTNVAVIEKVTSPNLKFAPAYVFDIEEEKEYHEKDGKKNGKEDEIMIDRYQLVLNAVTGEWIR